MEMAGDKWRYVNDTGFVLFLWQTDVFGNSVYLRVYFALLDCCLEYMEFIGFLDQRYLVIQYAMPVILVFLVFVAVNDDRRKGKKVVPLMILGIIAVLLYGMLSEIVKVKSLLEWKL